MHQTNCVTVLHTSEVLPVVGALMASNSGIHCAEVPSFQEMLDSQTPVFPFDKNYEVAKNEPIVILHSSGSTGKHLTCLCLESDDRAKQVFQNPLRCPTQRLPFSTMREIFREYQEEETGIIPCGTLAEEGVSTPSFHTSILLVS